MTEVKLDQYRWLKLEPVDAWFFRDGRPSNRGEDQSDLESEFPPNAATVVGALRAALAREHGWNGRGSWAGDANLKSILGDGFDDLGQLSFLGPLLMEGEEILWPMPRHIVGHTVEVHDDGGNLGYGFQPTGMLEPSPEPVLCDAGHMRLPKRKEPEAIAGEAASDTKRPEPLSGAFVTTAGMSKILSGQRPDIADCRRPDQLFNLESRVGIQREDATRTTGQNAMYSPRYVRVKSGISLAVGISGLPDDWGLPPLVPLGGESRMASVERVEQTPAFPSGETAGDYHLAISVTPAHFSDAWWGAGPNDNAAKLSQALSRRIATVMLDRPQRIGGWNSVDACPLPLRPFVPPGTVWWIESSETGNSRQLQVGQSIAYGYGLTLISGHNRIDV
jgi:CRISPR-associated protein Cmr3